MRILRKEENRLVFTVYPTKYFLLFMVFLILVCVYGLFHPDPSDITNFFSFLSIKLSASESIIAENRTTIALLLYLLAILIASYLIPIRVDIDKIAKTITYRYLAYHPIRKVGESGFIMMKVIPINDLRKLVYTDNIPEVPIPPGIHSAPNAVGKYCFMLKDPPLINVYVGSFSQFPHRYAFIKIAEYLKIPFVNDQDKEVKPWASADHAIKVSHLSKILLSILVGVIILLFLFVGIVLIIISSK